MAFLPNGYGAPNQTRPRGGDGTSVQFAIDNMIRSQLKVADPRDPKQVADALLAYYRDLPQAASISQEAQGLPFLAAPMTQPYNPATASPTSIDREFGIARGDVDRALQDLTTNALTNDIIPELQGWSQSLRGAIDDAQAAARQGLDPRQRDKVIAVRRQLGEYARLSRMVGSLSEGMTQNYRRLGQALDETAAVLLVMLGEALASVGYASGYYLLQVPFSELQQRRDAVIFALRNFLGGAQQAYGPDDWPRGVNAYRLLFDRLERQGQGDLRSLLVENELARSMDDLIGRAQNGTAEGLRALGATAQIDLERFRRLAIVARNTTGLDPSPPLVSFVEALLLFSDAFTPAGGLRLLRIARPPILLYGLYNPNVTPDDTLLVDLIVIRSTLATVLDSVFANTDQPVIILQILFDMVVASLDRAIDLMGIGAENDPTTDNRALAYWLIINAIQQVISPPIVGADAIIATIDAEFPAPIVPPGVMPITNRRADQLKRQLADIRLAYGRVPPTILRAILDRFQTRVPVNGDFHTRITQNREEILEELRVQKSLERRWPDLVRTVAPEAAGQDIVFDWLHIILAQALSDAQVGARGVPVTFSGNEIPDIDLPPQYETSLQRIADNQHA